MFCMVIFCFADQSSCAYPRQSPKCVFSKRCLGDTPYKVTYISYESYKGVSRLMNGHLVSSGSRLSLAKDNSLGVGVM